METVDNPMMVSAVEFLKVLNNSMEVFGAVSPVVTKEGEKATQFMTQLKAFASYPRQRVTRANLTAWARELRAIGLGDDAIVKIMQLEQEAHEGFGLADLKGYMDLVMKHHAELSAVAAAMVGTPEATSPTP